MEQILLDGKSLSNKLFDELRDRLKTDKRKYKLIVLTVGSDPASKVYVRNKEKACERVGIEYEHISIDEGMGANEFGEFLVNLEKTNPACTGIILQLPAPKHLTQVFNQLIDGKYDVDGFGDTNRIMLYTESMPFHYPATPKGIMLLLNNYNISVEGKHVVILGRSEIVGKPLSKLMLDENATVTVCHSKTQNLKEITRTADILVCAMGKPKFINDTFVKDGVIIVDVGINRLEDGSICGDVDFDMMRVKSSAITPVPGGVGPMTVYSLIENVICSGLYYGIEDI